MSLEPRFDYIDDLDNTSPLGTDQYAQGDDHLRGIKNVLTNQFPNLGDVIVTPTAEEINAVASVKTCWGGMSRAEGGDTLNIAGNNVLAKIALSTAVAYPNGVNTTVVPGDGEVLINTIAAEQCKITATLVLNQDTSTTVSNKAVRLFIIRKSNSSVVASGQMSLELPGYNEKVQFTLHALDPTPAAADEGYFLMMNHGHTGQLIFTVLDYHLWIDGRGT